MSKQPNTNRGGIVAAVWYRSRNISVPSNMIVSMAVAVALAGCREGTDFVSDSCDKLGNGIHQKVEEHTTEDGFTDLVIYDLFCGVELRAHGERTLRGHYTQETGYQVVRHWGYLKYAPTPESVKRAAVESGRLEVGTWNTRARGLRNTVVLDKGPEIVNGGWSYCAEGPDYQCPEKYR